MKTKNRYTIDNTNRLVTKQRKKRIISRGAFSIDKDNRLIYWLNEPLSWRRKFNLPERLAFDGNWQLNSNYDLKLQVNEINGQKADGDLVLKGRILSVDNDNLSFEIKGSQNKPEVLELSGTWQADEYNLLSFLVKKETFPDALTLQGAWEVNKYNQILYTYEKVSLKTKTKIAHLIAFKGYWQIDSAQRISYFLEAGRDSHFDFRVALESRNLRVREGVIKYRIGIGLKNDLPQRPQNICLFGKWQFSKKLGLSFDMDYGQGRIKKIEFGSSVKLSEIDEVELSLFNKIGKPLGISVTFTHKFLKSLDAAAFLRLKSSERESGVEVGLKIPF